MAAGRAEMRIRLRELDRRTRVHPGLPKGKSEGNRGRRLAVGSCGTCPALRQVLALGRTTHYEPASDRRRNAEDAQESGQREPDPGTTCKRERYGIQAGEASSG